MPHHTLHFFVESFYDTLQRVCFFWTQYNCLCCRIVIHNAPLNVVVLSFCRYFDETQVMSPRFSFENWGDSIFLLNNDATAMHFVRQCPSSRRLWENTTFSFRLLLCCTIWYFGHICPHLPWKNYIYELDVVVRLGHVSFLSENSERLYRQDILEELDYNKLIFGWSVIKCSSWFFLLTKWDISTSDFFHCSCSVYVPFMQLF